MKKQTQQEDHIQEFYRLKLEQQARRAGFWRNIRSGICAFGEFIPTLLLTLIGVLAGVAVVVGAMGGLEYKLSDKDKTKVEIEALRNRVYELQTDNRISGFRDAEFRARLNALEGKTNTNTSTNVVTFRWIPIDR